MAHARDSTFECFIEHDLSAVQEVLVDPIAENSEKFHGWRESDVNALQVKVDRKTLQRISSLDPDHFISDLSMVDINEMKCWELVKELKSRGLPSSGNRQSVLMWERGSP